MSYVSDGMNGSHLGERWWNVLAGEPVYVLGVSRGAEEVFGEVDGLHSDEVHRG